MKNYSNRRTGVAPVSKFERAMISRHSVFSANQASNWRGIPEKMETGATPVLRRHFPKRNIHQQIGGDFFQIRFQRGEVAAFGQLQSGGGLEERFAGHGRADTFAGKFLDVHIRARQCTGDLPDNARTVVPDDFEPGLPALGRGSRGFVGADDDGKAATLERLQGVEQHLAFFDRNLDSQNTGELAAETAHAAFQPVAAVLSHHARHRFDEAGAVRADDRHHQGNLHECLVKPSRRRWQVILRAAIISRGQLENSPELNSSAKPRLFPSGLFTRRLFVLKNGRNERFTMMLEYALEKFPISMKLRDGTECVVRPLANGMKPACTNFSSRCRRRSGCSSSSRFSTARCSRNGASIADFERNLPLLMLHGQKIIGEATLHQRFGGWKRHIGLITVLTHPNYRGRDVAKMLVEEQVEIARNMGLRRLEAELNGERKVAIRALEQIGFQHLMKMEDYVLDMKAVMHDYVLMGMDLRTDEEYAGVGG